ncbi:uncharacterized protein N7483_003666 [Penicillium malachiteum]|uniref:uncharacterized protein n=1 Tax=Penicillium malachiteum TaxID=1324776 RepID=UPI0025477313|nr:uncharacterized protein N7483_003666 [Penicillium malachiteum]KAJ5729158.1 hypothetical protein N7483_003666 [Penicillium malachiteum]
MPGFRQGNRRADRDTFDRPKSKPQQRPRQKQPERKQPTESQPQPQTPSQDADSPIDFSTPIPLSLQQLLLDVFKTALLTQSKPTQSSIPATDGAADSEEPAPLDIKSLIQTIKSHLYQRDFDAAFTDADSDLLRAYALRWSASRALGYAGIFKGVLGWMRNGDESSVKPLCKMEEISNTRVVCLGGGAGAEIVALAGVWRDLGLDGIDMDSLSKSTAEVSLSDAKIESGEGEDQINDAEKTTTEVETQSQSSSRSLSVAAVDIADWSSVVERLSKTIISNDVPFPLTSRHKPPLLARSEALDVSFRRADLLALGEQELKDVVLGETAQESSSLLVTLMFTLNELFSTSMPKATGFLLRLTEILSPGAILLVVDSPGSYSSVKLGKNKEGEAQERKYPMKFLLDHALTSVAGGKWERVYTQDSKWWRREAARLRYEVGEGAGLEDMRFQLHIYQRI